MELLLFLLLLPFLLFFLWPVRRLPFVRRKTFLEPPPFYLYTFVFHLHTQFSYDSLGKPEDLYKAMEEEGVDFAVVTDHEVDYFKYFADERVLVGVERKINDPQGRLLGDLIEAEGLKVVSHHFRKYRWKLERKKDYLFEVVNLKDALVENRKALLFYLSLFPFVYPFFKGRYLKDLVKVVEAERYARAYLREGWRNPVLGGLDHHVKVYVREVGLRFLFPPYRLSFKLLRNVLLTKKPLSEACQIPKALREGELIVSFSESPTLCWREGGKVKVYAPYEKVVVKVLKEKGEECYLGSSFELEGDELFFLCGYRYAFRLGSLFFGLKPLFLYLNFPLKEEGHEGEAHRQGRFGGG